MLIRRCAWHREFHGYTLVHGVAAWGGFYVKFTDGVCKRCAARVRIEWRVAGRYAETLSPTHPGGLRRAVLAGGLVLMVMTLMSITPISDPVPDESLATAEEEALTRRAGGPMAAESVHPPAPALTPRTRGPRRHPSKRTTPAVLPVMALVEDLSPAVPAFLSIAEAAPGEDQPTTAPQIQLASVAPSVSRASLIEEEFSLRVRRASLLRLSLSAVNMGGLDGPSNAPNARGVPGDPWRPSNPPFRSGWPGGAGALLDLASIQGP
jgi:hypothetical protein